MCPSYLSQHVLDSVTLARSDIGERSSIENSAWSEWFLLQPAVLTISVFKQDCLASSLSLDSTNSHSKSPAGTMGYPIHYSVPKDSFLARPSAGSRPWIPLTSSRRPPTMQADMSQALSCCSDLLPTTLSGFRWRTLHLIQKDIHLFHPGILQMGGCTTYSELSPKCFPEEISGAFRNWKVKRTCKDTALQPPMQIKY